MTLTMLPAYTDADHRSQAGVDRALADLVAKPATPAGMTTMRLALSVALLTLAVASDAKAAGLNLPSPSPTQKTVAECAAQVRAAIPQSVFGAYIDPRTGDVRSFGSEQEREHFSKCLARRGASEKLPPTSEKLPPKGTPR